MTDKQKPTICIDLDGTLIRFDEWNGVESFGAPFPGAQDFVKKLRNGFRVVINTCRTNVILNKRPAEELQSIVEKWLVENDFEFDEVFAGQGKPVAMFYVDDRAITCAPKAYGKPEDAYALALGAIGMICIAELNEQEE